MTTFWKEIHVHWGATHYNFYEFMGIFPNTNEKEIRKTYLRLMRTMHPDKHLNAGDIKIATEYTAILNNMYETLKIQDKRIQYDRKLQFWCRTTGSRVHKKAPNPCWESRNEYKDDNRGTKNKFPQARDANGAPQQHPTSQSSQSKHVPKAGNFSASTPNNHQDGRREPPSEESTFKRDKGSRTKSRRKKKGRKTERPTSHSHKTHKSNNGTSNHHDHPNHSTSASHDRGYSYYSNGTDDGSRRQRHKDPKTPHPKKDSSFNTKHPSNQQGQSSSHPRASEKKDPSHKSYKHASQRIFGVTKSGKACKICIRQRAYCHHHSFQDPANKKRHGKSSQNQSSSTRNDRREEASRVHNGKIFGYTLQGLPCRRCINQGDYCYQHNDQRYMGHNSRSNARASSCSYSETIYGVTIMGLPCKSCRKRGGFCHHHKFQEHRKAGVH